MTLCKQVLRQAMHRLWPFRLLPSSPEQRRLMAEGARTMGGIAQAYYFAKDDLRLIASTPYGLNLAEQAGAVTELARGYSIVSHMLANVPDDAVLGLGGTGRMRFCVWGISTTTMHPPFWQEPKPYLKSI